MRVLFCFPHYPEDLTSRSAPLAVAAAETLALSGAQARILAASAVVRPGRTGAYRFLEASGFAPRILPAKSGGRLRPEIHYARRSVARRVVDVGNVASGAWEETHAAAFDAAFQDELREFRPDVVCGPVTGPGSLRRFGRARAQGAATVLTLADARAWNPADAGAFDRVLCHTAWLAGVVNAGAGEKAVALPPPVFAADVTPESREPVCVTFAAPTRENGVYLMLRLAEQLSLAHPDLPILVPAAGGMEREGETLARIGQRAGFDLTQYENILVAGAPASRREIWAATQVFVSPSLSAPPLAMLAEAMVNGAPPVVSDRAGAPDLLGGAGFALPLPLDYTPETRSALPVAAVEGWVETVERLATDDEFCAAEAQKAREAARAFDPETLAPRYAAFFAGAAEPRP